MRNQFQLFLIFAASWTSTHSFQWSSEPPDNSVQRVCLGDDLHLMWDFYATGNANDTSIQWFFQEETVAIKSHGQFLAMATYYDRVRFVPGAGLVISHLVLADKGNYSVEVLGSGVSFANGKQRRSVTVELKEPPESDIDHLLVREDDTAWFDNSTRQWAVRLNCGHFVKLGQPPVDVIWTTPSGQIKTSSSQENGDFHLLLYSPVEGGNYMCSLRPQSPAASCLSNTSGLMQTYPYHVHQVQAQLKITQLNELQALREKEENQLLQEFREKEANMTNHITQLEKEMATVQLGPCAEGNHTTLDDNWRDVNYTTSLSNCDARQLSDGWYRFRINGTNARMPTSCVPANHCGTTIPVWLDLGLNDMPEVGQETDARGCGSVSGNCCNSASGSDITVRNCGLFLVYKLHPSQGSSNCRSYSTQNTGFCAEI